MTTEYESRVTRVTVLPNGDDLWSERATEISIEDEEAMSDKQRCDNCRHWKPAVTAKAGGFEPVNYSDFVTAKLGVVRSHGNDGDLPRRARVGMGKGELR